MELAGSISIHDIGIQQILSPFLKSFQCTFPRTDWMNDVKMATEKNAKKSYSIQTRGSFNHVFYVFFPFLWAYVCHFFAHYMNLLSLINNFKLLNLRDRSSFYLNYSKLFAIVCNVQLPLVRYSCELNYCIIIHYFLFYCKEGENKREGGVYVYAMLCTP